MDVYLIPINRGYRLYAESPANLPPVDEPPARGLVGRLAGRARGLVAAVEREDPQEAGRATGWQGRLRRWAARQVREQRVLWQLRREPAATIVAPDDCPDALAVDIVRRLLKQDADRHGRWLVIDSIGFVGSGLFMLVPGPNLIAYYFALSLAGHFLSWQGARHGRQQVTWQVQPDAALAELRRAIDVPADERDRRVHAVADRLHLPSLPGFFTRAVSRSA